MQPGLQFLISKPPGADEPDHAGWGSMRSGAGPARPSLNNTRLVASAASSHSPIAQTRKSGVTTQITQPPKTIALLPSFLSPIYQAYTLILPAYNSTLTHQHSLNHSQPTHPHSFT